MSHSTSFEDAQRLDDWIEHWDEQGCCFSSLVTPDVDLSLLEETLDQASVRLPTTLTQVIVDYCEVDEAEMLDRIDTWKDFSM